MYWVVLEDFAPMVAYYKSYYLNEHARTMAWLITLKNLVYMMSYTFSILYISQFIKAINGLGNYLSKSDWKLFPASRWHIYSVWLLPLVYEGTIMDIDIPWFEFVWFVGIGWSSAWTVELFSNLCGVAIRMLDDIEDHLHRPGGACIQKIMWQIRKAST